MSADEITVREYSTAVKQVRAEHGWEVLPATLPIPGGGVPAPGQLGAGQEALRDALQARSVLAPDLSR